MTVGDGVAIGCTGVDCSTGGVTDGVRFTTGGTGVTDGTVSVGEVRGVVAAGVAVDGTACAGTVSEADSTGLVAGTEGTVEVGVAGGVNGGVGLSGTWDIGFRFDSVIELPFF
ncbi:MULTISPECIES: hypothetical protein [Bifidobacterium]|uniref:hypothetical protein n=1 Tax=Bifidobacterium TaxID=1678 RepID=UPI001C38887B|nr:MULTISPECIES: hypothetical protein [Bifidobacterium]MBV3807388.1 hypothetical protein [Bifidobacterium adolescentis]MBV3836031.1 hypothetical protein [Bifidobacterium sp. MSK.17.10]MCG4567203.1 hypothetical protein [Bifidobacterium adolescentis]